MHPTLIKSVAKYILKIMGLSQMMILLRLTQRIYLPTMRFVGDSLVSPFLKRVIDLVCKTLEGLCFLT